MSKSEATAEHLPEMPMSRTEDPPREVISGSDQDASQGLPMRGHIVVIEDEPSVCQVLEEALGEHGFIVTQIGDGRAAQDLDPHEDIDLILMDLMLPGLDGIKLTAHLRASGFAHTPIIAVSASSIKLYCAQESGLFQACLPKPFDLFELLEYAEQYAGLYVTLSPPWAQGPVQPQRLARNTYA